MQTRLDCVGQNRCRSLKATGIKAAAFALLVTVAGVAAQSTANSQPHDASPSATPTKWFQIGKASWYGTALSGQEDGKRRGVRFEHADLRASDIADWDAAAGDEPDEQAFDHGAGERSWAGADGPDCGLVVCGGSFVGLWVERVAAGAAGDGGRSGSCAAELAESWAA